MGIFNRSIEVAARDLSRFETVELMVDTGSTYTWLPRAVVSRLGLVPNCRRQVRCADGRIIEKEGVDCAIRIGDEVHPNFCLIADSGDSHLLGALTLETFSLGVDPVNGSLVPIVASAAGTT